MRQQVGRGGGGVKQIQHPSQDGRWGQLSLAAAVGRGGVSLCLWRGQRASCEASCGERTEGRAPPPSVLCFPAWPCPSRPSPTDPGVLASWGTWPPQWRSAAGSVDCARRPSRARSPRAPWLRSGCRTGRPAGAQSPAWLWS